jgi:hypothetical protein
MSRLPAFALRENVITIVLADKNIRIAFARLRLLLMKIIYYWLAQGIRNLHLLIIRGSPTGLCPVQDCIKIATCVRDSWSRKNLVILRPPLERNRRDIARTHKAFSKRFDAVVEMLHVQRRASLQIVGAVVPKTRSNVTLNLRLIRATSSTSRRKINIPDNGVGGIHPESQGSLLLSRLVFVSFDQ